LEYHTANSTHCLSELHGSFEFASRADFSPNENSQNSIERNYPSYPSMGER
jgi:hypothetical protein